MNINKQILYWAKLVCENDNDNVRMKVWYIADQEGEPLDYLEGLENGYYVSEKAAEEAMSKWMKEHHADMDPDFYYSIKSVYDTVNPEDILK